MDEDKLAEILESLQFCLDDKDGVELCSQFSGLHPAEIAQILSSVDSKVRSLLWSKIDNDTRSDILKELGNDVKLQLISSMSVDDIVATISVMDTDDLADIVPFLPESALHNLLLTLDNKHRKNLRKALSYSSNTAGGLMNTDIITIRPNVSVRTVIRYLRLLGSMPKDTDQLFVVDRDYKYIGSIHISSLLSSNALQLIKDLLNQSVRPIDGNTKDSEVAILFEQRDLISAPVVDKNNQLIGRVTIDDVVDVIRENAESSMKSMAGISGEELFSPVLKSSKNRGLWLGVNLITIFIAVFFIDLFAETIEQTIALAVLMPVVASMGGIAGTQSLILITRGVATGVVSRGNIGSLLNKEIIISLLNGVLWSVVIAFITYIWFADIRLSLIIAVAIIVNIFSAAIFGSLLPLILERFGIDPALAGGVILTTITDVIGFVAFLGLATIVL